ncbi:MAG TPA: NAD(P)/FAD-dependent oxidoreductase [Candidatus Acidoferrales bacterium]|nr:NAD(P)/FAD-dependent oxidoreductase [Candidatus Acidoferrales bacterium]
MKRIVVLGSGFAGMQAVIDLERLFRKAPDYEILLISDQNYVLFTPLLPQIASSQIDPRHIAQAVRDVRGSRRFRFLRDTVSAIDLANRRIDMTSGAISYDSLVITLGSRTNYFGVSGAREHTYDFKSLEDSIALRERVLDLCEHADHLTDENARHTLLTFAVVGGGYTGVELLTDLRDFLFDYVARHYRGIPRNAIRLVLVEASDSILNGIHPLLRAHAMKRLKAEGIEILYNSRVTRCFEGGIEIHQKENLQAATIIWTAGVRAHEVVEELPGSHDRAGRAQVNEYLQMENFPEVFVAGDSAAASSAAGASENVPQVAPVAIAHGKIAARNLAHRERDEPLESYRYVSQGMLVSLGARDAVVSVGGIQIHGSFAWLFWNAVHLYKLVNLKKQFQVAVDWSLGTIFPRDTVLFRRPSACKLCAAESAAPAPVTAASEAKRTTV